ncbi:sialate O-acetylesterase [Alteromonadaceae bacterium BrNp21-10]|nr:sialate O-acetylesterase [Alteromonadaceae bacterium BrNp21-10]
MPKSIFCKTILLGLMLMLSTSAIAQITLSPLFSEHMVLQRDKPVRVWGTAAAGQTLSISIAKHQLNTKADSDGNWQVMLPASSKGGPYTLKINADEILSIDDVYFGDVWIAGGQSNMEWKLSWGIDNLEQETLDAEYPQIRVFEVPNIVAHEKQQMLPDASWKLANQKNVMEFSAIAWFFAKHLHQEQNVAVGIIDSNWGGTPAEAWTEVNKLTAVNGYEQRAQEVIKTADWDAVMAENSLQEQRKYQLIGDLDLARATNAYKNDIDLSNWQTVDLPNKQPLHDLVWLRKSFTLDALPTTDSELFLGDLVQNALIFLNDELIAEESWQDSESRHQIAKDKFVVGDNQITLRVANDWDNNVFAGRPGEMWLQSESQKINLEGQWYVNNKLQPPLPKVKRFSFTPGFLYNAMIHPLLPYTTKGVIWYQGENNVGEHPLYHELFSTMITNWRERAQDASLPFLFVQLAAYLKPQALQPKSPWAYLRDSQRQTLTLPNTAMATTIDIGEADNIHPANKQDVGKRLWLQAKRMVYGQNNVPSGPDYSHHEIDGENVILHFDYAEQLHSNDKLPIKGFIIAGADKQFYPANANIDGEIVRLSHPKVKQPKAVRYAWADYPQVNLVNQQGLPAIPFRTDNWTAEQVQ